MGIPISKETIDLCMTIVENSVTCDLPYANTEASKAFTLIAGPQKILLSEKLVVITFTVILRMYLDQGMLAILGNRVREHANHRFSTTSSYITSLYNEGKVTLYLVPSSYNLPLDISTFLTILEQFIFFVLQPSVNISLVATPGLIPSNKERIISEELLKTWVKLYIYRYDISDNSFELIHILPNTDSFCKIAGKSKLWARNIIREEEGWYRKELFLSNIPLDTSKSCLINQEELTDLVNKLQQKTKGGKQVMVINLQTNEKTIYPSIRSCARALNVSQTPIKHEAIINSIYKIVYL